MSHSVWPHWWKPTRFPCPWDSPDKNTGVGCHFRLQCMKVKSESEIAQSCPTLHDPTLCDPIDGSLPGSSIHGIFQARQEYWSEVPLSSPISCHIVRILHRHIFFIKWEPTPVFLLGKSHGQGYLEGYSPWSCNELEMT